MDAGAGAGARLCSPVSSSVHVSPLWGPHLPSLPGQAGAPSVSTCTFRRAPGDLQAEGGETRASNQENQHPRRKSSDLCIPMRMPDLQDISSAISELRPEAITDIGVLASKKEPPADYSVIAQTTDGFDANLWKDSIFKSKVTRYLCFSRASFTKNKQLCNVVVDMKLMDLKECLPEGFTSIQDTMDSQEQALRKERLCVKLVPRHTTDTAICDVIIQGKSKHSLANYTYIGEMNSLGIWCQLGKVTKLQDTANKLLSASTITSNDARQFPESPASSPTKKNIVRPDYEHHIHNLYTKSAVDDIPFTISKKHVSTTTDEIQPPILMGISIKSPQEIEEEYNYCFITEHSAAAF